MKNNVCLFMAVLVITAFPICALSAPYSGGDGSPENPYQIANKADLLALGADTDNYGQCFILTADIDLAGETFTTAVIAPDTDTTNENEDFLGTPFTGVFNGNFHIISNLTIAGAGNSYAGLFGDLGSAGFIVNLGMVNATVSADDYVGILAGQSDGTIQFCYATGSVSGANYVGGLVGESWSTIYVCYSKANVSGTGDYIGGLAGSCNFQNTIVCCYAAGHVTATGSNIGGLAGFAWAGNFSCCFWDIQTSGQTGSAGGKGLTTVQMKTMSIYQNAGWATTYAWVINNGVDYPRLYWENMGGILIPPAPEIPLTGSGTALDPYRVTTAQEFASLSWYPDILDKYITLTTDLNLNGIAVYPIGDLGTFKGVFDGNSHTLSNIVINQPGGEYVGVFTYVGPGGQIRNLGIINANIQGNRFVGGIAGRINGAAIDSCWATGSVSGIEYVGGLAGLSENSANTSCHTTISVSGSDSVGGLIGEGYTGTITTCYATGSVNGSDYAGGLIGYNGSTITSSYAAGAVTGTGWEVGGLAGFNWGDIEFCYATGPVNGNSSVGGLLGANSASIFYCYAAGSVNGSSNVGGLVGSGRGTSDHCFWDIQTSGQSSSASDGIGKTTAQMKTLSTFTDAGWDFTGVWALCEGTNYPRLKWQISAMDWVCPDGMGIEDFAYLAARWLRMDCATTDRCEAADLDGSGAVDLTDLAILVQNWLTP